MQLYTDSQYVRNGIMEWLPQWKKRGWKTADKKPVKNADLWVRLEQEIERHEVTGTGSRAIRATSGNERADALANMGIANVAALTDVDSSDPHDRLTAADTSKLRAIPLRQASTMDFIDLKTQYRRLKPSVDARIAKVLEHGQYVMGPEVAELEQRLAAYVGAKHGIGVASGTDALLIALMALDIGPGDEVITVPFTFFATAEMIALIGAKPVFVDIDPRTYNMDPALLEAAITPRTKAIMPVSLYGQCADIDAINAIACQPRTARHRGRRAEFRRDLQGPAFGRHDGHRRDVVLSVEAARLLRRRRRAVHERRSPGAGHARDPRARPGPPLSPSAPRAHGPARFDPGGRAAGQARDVRRRGRGAGAGSARAMPS